MALQMRLRLSWDEVAGIYLGLERGDVRAPQRIGVDETSFPKRHGSYATVISDLDGHVLHAWPTGAVRSCWRSTINSSTVSS